jgi:hypothetical protein
MTEQNAPESPETDETAPEDAEAGNAPEDGAQSPESDPETFPRAYVQQLRDENAKYRTRAQRADDLGARLHTALVTATGRLADADDLPFDEAHLDDVESLSTAIDDLLTRKPHLASRRPVGDVGQGATAATESVDLAGLLRSRAS